VHQRSRSGGRLRWHLFLLFFLVSLVLAVAAAGGAGLAIYRSYADDLRPPSEVIVASGTGPSRVYDRKGSFLYEFLDPLAGIRDPVPLEEMSPWLIKATIATEDASFYDNPGVNVKGLIRAAWENLPEPLGEGYGEGSGGSSLTQQLVKNIYLTPEERLDRRIERKIKEIVLALELKRQYEDDQILGWYLNQINYGSFAYGAEAAARLYFGKTAKDLTLAEAALLAGIPQAPALYTPILPENRPQAIERQHQVLDLMARHHYLTPAQAEDAKREPLNFVTPRFDIQAPHFVFHVHNIVIRMCQKGLFKPTLDVPCEKAVTQGDLKITTTMDLELQRIGEVVVEEIISANEDKYNGHNGAIVAIDPRSGEILAMVGSRDFFREDIEGQVNMVTSLRSHGSTMKVFTYLTAFKEGWVPSTAVQDEPLTLETPQGTHRVNNWNFANMGDITVRTALSQSVNVPAVRTVMEVGEDQIRRTAHELGVTDLPDSRYCGPTITLGSCEVKLLDMTFAYATIANNGVMKGMPTMEDLPDGFRELDPVSVLKIEDSDGNVLYEYPGPETKDAIRAAYAYMITDILSRDAIQWSRLSLPFPATSKTGTSEDFKDSLVVGYTPNLAAGVWMGNTDGTPMADRTFSSAGAGPIWRTFMAAAYEQLGLSADPFAVPPDIVFSPCGDHQEVFVSKEVPRKPGGCLSPGQTVPTFPLRTPTPTPTPISTPGIDATGTPTPTPISTPGIDATGTPTPTPISTPGIDATGTPTPQVTPDLSGIDFPPWFGDGRGEGGPDGD
jgi:membrane peptidoglycan carboxypeptidase